MGKDSFGEQEIKLPGLRSLGHDLMERKSQGTEVSETPVANSVLCITSATSPCKLGQVWDPAPSLGYLDSMYTLGHVSQPPKVSLKSCTGCLSPSRQD